MSISPKSPAGPSTRTLERFHFRSRFGDRRELQTAITKSLTSAKLLFPAPVPKRPAQPTLRDVLLAKSTREVWGDAYDAKEEAQAIVGAIDRDIVGPLLAKAAETDDPVTANTYLMLASYSRDMHRDAVQQVWLDTDKAEGQPLDGENRDKKIDQRLRQSGHILRLMQFVSKK